MCFKKILKKKSNLKQEDVFVPMTSSIVNFMQLENTDDQILTKIASDIQAGIPHILNFELIEFDEANKAMAFLSGVVYAIEGEIYTFKNGKNFLFADKHVYEDGTINNLIKEIQGD